MHILHKVKIVVLTILFTILSSNIVFANALDEFNEKKYNSAFRSAFTAVASGDSEAAYVLGKLYMLGLGDIKKSPAKAIKYLNIAINNKYSPAAVFLATEYQKGKNLKRNYAEARRLYIKAQDGGANYSKNIALLSQKMSDDDLTINSCKDAKKAAEKNARTFYLYYTRCMLREVGVKKNIPLILKYVEKVKYKTQEEEILSLAKILSEGPKELRNPADAYMLIEQYINNKEPNESLLKELETLRNNIQFKIEDCTTLIKTQNQKNTLFVCNKIEESNNPQVLVSLHDIYQNNRNLFSNFDENKKQILKKAIKLGSENALPLLASLYNERDEKIDFLSYLTSSQNDKSISANIRNVIKEVINEENIALMTDFNRNPSIKNTIIKSIENKNCNLLKQVINIGDVSFLHDISTKIDLNDINCNNDRSFEIISAIKDLKKSKIKKAFFSFKELCAQEIQNSCLFLAEMYINDNLPSSMESFDKKDRQQFAIVNLKKSVDMGNTNSMVLLGDLLLTNNQDIEKAKLILDSAVAKGKVDALYIKAKHLLKKTFFAGKETCKPLLEFLSNNVSNSIYFEEAIQLNKKRCR